MVNESKFMDTLLKQQLVKEKINEFQPSSIPGNFYEQVRDWKKNASEKQIKEMDWKLNSLLRKRLGKLLTCASVVQIGHLEFHLADEEMDYFAGIFELSEELKNGILRK